MQLRFQQMCERRTRTLLVGIVTVVEWQAHSPFSPILACLALIVRLPNFWVNDPKSRIQTSPTVGLTAGRISEDWRVATNYLKGTRRAALLHIGRS